MTNDLTKQLDNDQASLDSASMGTSTHKDNNDMLESAVIESSVRKQHKSKNGSETDTEAIRKRMKRIPRLSNDELNTSDELSKKQPKSKKSISQKNANSRLSSKYTARAGDTILDNLINSIANALSSLHKVFFNRIHPELQDNIAEDEKKAPAKTPSDDKLDQLLSGKKNKSNNKKSRTDTVK